MRNSIDFDETNKHFLSFIPDTTSRVLDVGAGAGQNAAALARLGHSVVAAEPMSDFLDAARSTYTALDITWVEDHLPLLENLNDGCGLFDFILVQAVWHHLEPKEQQQSMARIAELLRDGGVCALTLRNGPAGAGKHVFPTDGEETVRFAEQCGLETLLHLPDQPSIIKNKPDVSWAHLSFKKHPA